MAINFPNAPTVGQVFTFGDQSFKWNGSVWLMLAASYPIATDAEVIAGVVTNKMVTPAGGAARLAQRNNAPQSPFYGNANANGRTEDVNYQNNRPNPMGIVCRFYGSGGANVFAGPTNPATLILMRTAAYNTTQHCAGFLLVPAYWWYRFELSSGAMHAWHEYY